MENNLFPILLILLLGILMGGLIGWLIAKLKYAANSITAEDLKANYVLKEIFDALQLQSDLYRDDLMDKEEHIRSLGSQLSTREQVIINQEEKLNHQQQEFAALQERSRIEFENIANRLLEEKSEKFTAKNQEQIQNILNPLREKIKDFEANMDKKFLEDTKDKISLKEEIKHLRVLNEQLSQDAGNLVAALKGDSKTQGDWGELRLELLLEKAGLTKNIHYLVQPSYRDENGKQKRPDFIINLPNNKHLIVDSKVSLKAYEKYFNADSKEKQDRHLKAHCDSLRKHIRDLASKNYQQLYQIHSPDYLLLFVPIEPAFTAATQADSKLFLEALDRNIVIVTTSTLLATMRTVSYIWKQEKQKRSVLEIARQSGLLYDKFVNFVEDLKQIGYRLDSTKSAYADAMNKLVDSRKFGDTLVGRAERIRELGAKSSKRLPRELIDTIENQKIPTNEKPIQPR